MMNSRASRSAFLWSVVLLLPLSAGAETFRCGKWLITAEMTAGELINKCGSPTSRESRTEDVRARQGNGLVVKIGETTTERWTYDRGSQAAPMVVIVVDGTIKSIERLRK